MGAHQRKTVQQAERGDQSKAEDRAKSPTPGYRGRHRKPVKVLAGKELAVVTR